MADGITPSELHAEITRILAEESGCSASWAQHPQPLDAIELIRIWIRVGAFIGVHIVRYRELWEKRIKTGRKMAKR